MAGTGPCIPPYRVGDHHRARRFFSNLSHSTIWLDRAVALDIERGFAHFEEWRDMCLAEEEREQHKINT